MCGHASLLLISTSCASILFLILHFLASSSCTCTIFFILESWSKQKVILEQSRKRKINDSKNKKKDTLITCWEPLPLTSLSLSLQMIHRLSHSPNPFLYTDSVPAPLLRGCRVKKQKHLVLGNAFKAMLITG